MEKEVQSAESEKAKLRLRYEGEIKSLKKHVDELVADINQMNVDKHTLVDLHDNEVQEL